MSGTLQSKRGQGKRSPKNGTGIDDQAASADATIDTLQGSNEAKVTRRLSEYLVFSRATPGLQPAVAVQMINDHLTQSPDIKMKRRIAAPTFNAADAGHGAEGFVFEATLQKAEELRLTAAPGVIVEHNARLQHFGVLAPRYAALQPVITASSLVSTPVQIKVVALGGSPISRAAITLFGKGYPQHAVTDDNGLATLSVFGGDCRTVTYLYVKPYSGYWECWQEKPHLEFEAVNTVVLKPLDPAVDLPGGLGWGQRLMGLDQLGGERFTGEGAKIAIIDSGCDTQHQALNHIKKGYDFTNPDAVAAASSWTNDTMGHGTHCAGIIAGNGRGMRGFAPKADIHILKLFEGGAFDALMAALAYAAREGIDVVNCSLGSEEISEAVMVRLEQARQAGVAVIVAAGNSAGQVQFPARLPNVLAVSAIGRTGAFPQDSYHAETIPEPGTPGVNIGQNGLFAARFSCFGPEVDVCAPGVAIISTVPGGAYAAWDGTSMAAPHITGLAALVAAHHPAFANNAMPRDASRVDNLFQIVLSIAKSVGLAREYAGAGLPAGGSFAAVNGQLPAAPANQALPPDFESKIRVIVTATLGLMQKNGELGRIPPI